MLKPASEILDVSIGGFTSMRLQYLKNASKPNGSRIPPSWSSNRCYEELEREGFVIEGHDVTPGWQRQWLITNVGRDFLNQHKREPPCSLPPSSKSSPT